MNDTENTAVNTPINMEYTTEELKEYNTEKLLTIANTITAISKQVFITSDDILNNSDIDDDQSALSMVMGDIIVSKIKQKIGV